MKKEDKLRVNIAGIKLRNPILMASGTYGYGTEYTRIEGVDLREIGGVILKGTFLKPRKGTAPPFRAVETPAGMLNAIGLESCGIDDLINEKIPRISRFTRVFANIADGSIDEYAEIAGILNKVSELSGVEVNISCPNVQKGGQAFGTDPKEAYRVIRAVVRNCDNHPVIAKLTPNVTDITSIALACVEAGANALSLINTVVGMAIDVSSKRPYLTNNYGGLSGPAIKPIGVARVCQVYQAFKKNGISSKIPLIGVGGISSGKDALEYILAGARAVQLGTINFRNPRAYREILDYISSYLISGGYRSISDRRLVGSVRLYK
ncbi:MAG: dihydroorotate dehydrogenase [Deltaproteobacteria bacterium]|nr:MAG: dihydroorotate dehydrogenase [Deltaproteobacteria bacterium]